MKLGKMRSEDRREKGGRKRGKKRARFYPHARILEHDGRYDNRMGGCEDKEEG